MLQHAQTKQREGGFTLIELLVVMIIIAILMAVAVPTFLSQKQNAVATKTKSNIKQIVTAIESCAASNVTGQYNEAAHDCLATTATGALATTEPEVGKLLAQPAPEDYNVTMVAGSNGTGYSVTGTAIGDGGATVTWTETHAGGTAG